MMKLKVWGARGSIPAPGPETARYGGNTSCIGVTLSDGTHLVLDAGTGIRPLGNSISADAVDVQILLTHLHLDHIQGLMFFAPCFRPETELTVWGPEAPGASLEDRIARYISAPLSPVEVRELPCCVSFRDCPTIEWQIGPARVQAASVTHRGPTLGYRITDGEDSLCYIPDHEPGISPGLATLEPDWISGFELAQDASLLIHDCQYTDVEYPQHVGWGHSAVSDALTFARRTNAKRLLLFHHDPLHTDAELDALQQQARERWAELGGSPESIEMAVEQAEITIGGDVPAAAAEAVPAAL